MKVTLRANQVKDWQELADLIGAKHPTDAVAYMGSRYLQLEAARLRQQHLPIPPEVSGGLRDSSKDLQEPKRTPTEPIKAQPLTEFDDVFDSVKF
jgi:hypothetical protein